ncbi:MAG: hypothetical protein DRR42_03710 [Gammaproteobacteria bacterium]|nr:MAG: hypothetical protein DRR42_03710 [Gammaproteobacteria bacterium]
MITIALQKSEQYLRQTYRKILFSRARIFHNYIFIHINKTGGTSVEKALGLPLIHKTALEYKTEIGNIRWQEQFSFAIIRNPWDKIASQYHYRSMINKTQLKKTPVPFNDWVKWVFVDQNPNYYDDPKMFAPQVDWLTDLEGNNLVDFVGRFENLHNDWHIICEKINRQGAKLPHVKKSSKTDYRSYYNTESISIIADWFVKDTDKFSYSFD